MNLKQFASENSWQNQMDRSKGLDGWSNYGGPSLGHVVVVPGVSRSRDSEIHSESNFESALEMLGGESETVEVHRFGHWGCGWYELILIDPKDRAALKIAHKIAEQLKGYPLLDEDDFNEREYEYHLDFANGAKKDLASALCLHLGLPAGLAKTDAMLDLARELNIECQRGYGNDSCINVYKVRDPDEYDWKRVEECLRDIYGLDENPAYDLLCACFGIIDDECQ